MALWLRAGAFVVVVPGMVGGWLPWYIAGAPPLRRLASPLSVAGVLLAALGWLALLWCAGEFGRRGRGTPAPYDPPRALVRSGLYRVTRNPMYVAVLTSILGEALWFHSRAVLLYAAVAAVCFHLMIVLYEEPRLARDFGTTYAAYRASVPRWLLPLRRRTGG